MFYKEDRFFISSGLMFLLVVAVFSVLRNLKDTLVQLHIGTEAVPYIKLFVVLPVSLFVLPLLIKLFNHFKREQIFKYSSTIFSLFILIFAIYVYPNINHFCVSCQEDGWSMRFLELKYLLKLLTYWPLIVFYSISEIMMWVMVQILLWQMINDVTSTQNAKKFYPLYGIFIHFGVIMGTSIVNLVKWYCENTDNSNFKNYLFILIVIAVILLYISSFVFHSISKNIKGEESKYKEKPKLSVIESLKYIFRSKYLLLICFMIIGFGIQDNLLALLMKKYIAICFQGDPIGISNFSAKFYFMSSLCVVTSSVVFHFIMKKCSWLLSNIIAFIILFIIFTFYCINISKGTEGGIVGTGAMVVLNTLALQQLLSRVVKHSVVAPAKEMLYVPLESELRGKGKVATEMIGISTTKAISGGFIILMLTFSNIDDISGLVMYITIISAVSLFIWFFTICMINESYKEKIREDES